LRVQRLASYLRDSLAFEAAVLDDGPITRISRRRRGADRVLAALAYLAWALLLLAPV
jgi:hypothetical protein